jgi:hypothetical protein
MRIGMMMMMGVLWPVLCLSADERAWEAREAAETELHALEAQLRLCDAALEAYREAVAARPRGELAAKRRAVEDAEKAVATAQAEAGLKELRDRLQAARAARDAKVEELLADAPSYRAARTRQEQLQKNIADMESRVEKLKADELLELARLRLEERDLGRRIGGALRAWWKRGEVEPLYKAADQLYKSHGTQSKKAVGLEQAGETLKTARQALAEATAALPVESAAGKQLLTRRAELEAKIAESRSKLAELDKSLLAGKTHTITIKTFDRRAKQEVDKKVSLWLPAHHEQIRGVIVAHPMISRLASAQPIRVAAAREGLGMMVYDQFVNDGRESLARLDAVLEMFAAESGHPELRGAAVLLGGLSASVLGTRNVACAVPERVFGIVHAAGGNMQEMPDDGRGMVQVPFLALNGEFEWCGPIGGIRPEYGNQTQWVMIREQMLRLWRDKHQHRMSLVVVPNADHGAWDVGLTALFVRKAAQYRLPKEKRDGSTPAVCAPLPVNRGWLTDADLDHPQHEPAPYDSYTGDKNNAFWHFDEQMARAVYEYHKDKFILPDPTKTSPVPAGWPPGRK